MSDSFKRIIADSQYLPCIYARNRGRGSDDNIRCTGCMFAGLGSCDKKMRRDLVRRCKELCDSCEVADD